MADSNFLIPTWKWIGLAGGLTAGFIGLLLGRRYLKGLKDYYANKPQIPAGVRYILGKDIHQPLAWLIALTLWRIGLESLGLHEGLTHALLLGLHLFTLLNLMRLVYQGVESLGQLIEDALAVNDSSLNGQLAPFATKVLKFIVVTFAILMSLQSLGLNVGAVLAGLGIGSLAFALAAQDTVANLFGSITIIFDRPFQRGDLIKIGDTEGVVEDVGFRSTRVRTGSGSLITVPNSIVAKERIENLGVRPTRRFRHVLALGGTANPEHIVHFVEALRLRIGKHPLVAPQPTVTLSALGTSDVKILIDCYFQTQNNLEEISAGQELLLITLHLAEESQLNLVNQGQRIELLQLPSAAN